MSYKSVTRPILDRRQQKNRSSLALWRRRGTAALRILFGGIWAFNAWFAWQLAFAANVPGYLTRNVTDQPPIIAAWMTFWTHIVNLHPHLFAFLVATGATLIALGLIFGFLNNLTCGTGMILSLFIWSTAEGLGKPYGPITADVGVMILSLLLFAGLLLSGAGQIYGADRSLARRLGRWSFLASGAVDALSHRPVITSIQLPPVQQQPTILQPKELVLSRGISDEPGLNAAKRRQLLL